MSLSANEICKVRSDAVGGKTKAYAYAIVARNNKASARVVVLDGKLVAQGTFTVKHAMLWKLKANVRRDIEGQLARKKKAADALTEKQAIEESVVNDTNRLTENVVNAGMMTKVTTIINPQTIDGLQCVKEIHLKNKSTILTIALDSVTNCTTGAIVNAANTGCLGGGGIDGRIGELGGRALYEARVALPTLNGTGYGPRCAVGDAKMTIAGDLPCDKVIHAVGPSFGSFPPFDQDLMLLANAYKNALALARAEGLTKVAFCIISAGIFRGGCSLLQVIETGLTAIISGVYPELERVYFCAYSSQEQAAVFDTVNKMAGFEDSEDDGEEDDECDEE